MHWFDEFYWIILSKIFISNLVSSRYWTVCIQPALKIRRRESTSKHQKFALLINFTVKTNVKLEIWGYFTNTKVTLILAEINVKALCPLSMSKKRPNLTSSIASFMYKKSYLDHKLDVWWFLESYCLESVFLEICSGLEICSAFQFLKCKIFCLFSRHTSQEIS